MSVTESATTRPGAEKPEHPRPEECLAPTEFLDYEHPAVQAYIEEHAGTSGDTLERLTKLYYAVRDGLRYNPYTLEIHRESFYASTVVGHRQSYCIPKAVLFAAVARALGVPARLGFGDVKNHLSSQRLIDYLRTDVFAFHGYAELFLNGGWVQATPAFDARLCRKFGVPPLEFDGVSDGLFQPFDTDGRQFMEYIRYHGVFADMPHQWLLDGLKHMYPHIYEQGMISGDLMEES